MTSRSGYTAQTRTGNVTAAQVDTLFKPSKQTATHGVILCHGATAPMNFIDQSRIGSAAIGPALATSGFPCIAAEMSGDTYANDTAMTAMTNALTYLAAQTGVPSTKVHLFGASMGAAVALRWAYLNPTKVASITGIIPLTSIDSVYQSNAGGLRAAIGTAWGVTHPTPLPSGADLIAQAPTLLANNIPVQFYIAGSDALVSAADVNAYATASGGTVIGPVGSAGHTETGIANIGALESGNWSEVIEFLEANDG